MHPPGGNITAPPEVGEGVRIDIWSDYVCPFCTLGERHLSLALEDFPARDEVEVIWRSFQLDPTAPKTPTGTAADYLVRAKGMPLERVEAMSEDLAQRAAEVGLEYNWREGVISNSLDAHRLGHLAREAGLGGEWDEAVKFGYFTGGVDIADHDQLRGFADRVGLDRSAVDRVLASGEYADAVAEEIALGQRIGVQGVPFFVFDGKFALSGAQPVEVFTRALNQALADE